LFSEGTKIMIHLTHNTPIVIAIMPIDFRRGIDGIAALCKQQLAQEPGSGTLFVFINRRKTMVRVLVYENNGYWLMTKRLSRGKFSGWPRVNKPISAMDATHLRRLLKVDYAPL
jgi:transposase